MPLPPANKRLMISYSRRNEAFAEDLQQKLEALGYHIWRDRHDMMIGQDWWRQIQENIAASHTVILCLSPDSLISEVVKWEWQHARAHGIRIMPVIAGDGVDYTAVPRWLGRIDIADFRPDSNQHEVVWSRFVEQLAQDYPIQRVVYMGDTPRQFVMREKPYTRLKQALIEANISGQTVGLTAAIQGAGGFGKTTLTQALCQDADVRNWFYDGILWVTVGENATESELLEKALDLIERIRGQRPQLSATNRESVTHALREIIAERYILLVVDDVWSTLYEPIFTRLGKNATTLITTRSKQTLPRDMAAELSLDQMTDVEGVTLFTAGLDIPAAQKIHCARFASRFQGWALLLELANRAFHEQMKRKKDVVKALAVLEEDYADLGALAFDRDRAESRNDAIDASLKASLTLLSEADQTHLFEIGVFRDDTVVPLEELARLWGMKRLREAERLCETLDDLALLKYEEGYVRLHDEIRRVLRRRCAPQRLLELHEHLLGQWGLSLNTSDSPSLEKMTSFAWTNYAYHLLQIPAPNVLHMLLKHIPWLEMQLKSAGSLSILTDLEAALDAVNDPTARLLHSAIEISLHILSKDPRQLAIQLQGRLHAHRHQPDIAAFLADVKPLANTLVPRLTEYAPLQLAGATLKRVLEGHTGEVRGALELSNGQILSWSEDYTLRVWDRHGGIPTLLKGHTDSVRGALELSNGQILSWSEDYTLRIWDRRGNKNVVLEGHTASIQGSLQLSNGQILSWGDDHTLCVWDLAGSKQSVFVGHQGEVLGSLQLSNGQILSWGDDHTLRVWDLAGSEQAVFRGHTDTVIKVSELSTGRLLSRSTDGTLRLWNIPDQESTVLEGHGGDVWGMLELSDGRILSWSEDQTLRVWDATGAALTILTGHTAPVIRAIELHNGQILSWGEDQTLRVWDAVGQELAVLAKHEGVVDWALQLHDNSLLSWGEDQTLRLWDTSGRELSLLAAQTGYLMPAKQLRDDSLLTWGADTMLRLWDAMGHNLFIQNAHTTKVQGLLKLSSGSLLSWSDDSTLHLWTAAGSTEALLVGHTDSITGVRELRDGALLSWSKDATLRLWTQDGHLITVLIGHTGPINGARELRDGRILSWSDDQTGRLWERSGEEISALKHSTEVGRARELTDGSLLSWTHRNALNDHTLYIWDPSGQQQTSLTGHTEGIWGALELSNGRLLSWSDDCTLRLWDRNGQNLSVLEKHAGPVIGAFQLRKGGIISWSVDHTLWVWTVTGEHVLTLAGHMDLVMGAINLPQQQILSWSADKTLRVWDITTGHTLKVMEGHMDWVVGSLVLKSHRILSWSDDGTVRLWNSNTAQQIAAFYGDAPISCAVALNEETIVVGDKQGRVIFLRLPDL